MGKSLVKMVMKSHLVQRETNGTTIILTLKEDTDEEKYSQYLETYELKRID